MINAAVFTTTFLAAAVEIIEMVIIVVGVGAIRGWRSTLLGTGAGLAVVAALILALGTALTYLPINGLRVVAGSLLFVFGLQWLRKGIRRVAANGLRGMGAKNATDDDIPAHGMDWIAFLLAFRGVVLEGLEVAIIVATFGAARVQPGHLTRGGAPQLQLQQPGEQPVVAEPRPRRVQRHHERVRGLQVLQDPLAARIPRQRVGQLAADPLHQAGPQQQPPHLLALLLQHLGQQVLGHGPLAAGELGREPLRIAVPGQRQRRQPQPRRPPLSPLIQQRQRRTRQVHPRRRQ